MHGYIDAYRIAYELLVPCKQFWIDERNKSFICILNLKHAVHLLHTNS